MRTFIKLVLFLMIEVISSQDIAFIGNSITASGYNEIVESMLRGYNTHNYGVPGISVAINGFQYKDTPEFTKVITLKPQHVVILLGSNDWKVFSAQPPSWGDIWQEEYRYLVAKFKINSTVFLGTIPYHYNDSNSIQPIKDMNKRIRKVANRYSLEVIDFNTAIGWDPTLFKSDGIHPNGDGRKAMAEAAYNVLVNYPANKYLNIDSEYWDDVEDYEEQKKTGWIGCQP